MMLLELLFVASTLSLAVGGSLEDNIAFQMLLFHDKDLDDWYRTQDEISNPHRPKGKIITEPLPGYVRLSLGSDVDKSGYHRRQSSKDKSSPSKKLEKSETKHRIKLLTDEEPPGPSNPPEESKSSENIDILNTSEDSDSTVVDRPKTKRIDPTSSIVQRFGRKIETPEPNVPPTSSSKPTTATSDPSASPKGNKSSEDTSKNPVSTVADPLSNTKIKTPKTIVQASASEPTHTTMTAEPSEPSSSPKESRSSEKTGLPKTSKDSGSTVVDQPKTKRIDPTSSSDSKDGNKIQNPNEKEKKPNLGEGNSTKPDSTENIKSSESTNSAYTSDTIPNTEGKESRNKEDGMAHKQKEKDVEHAGKRPVNGQEEMEITRSVA